MILHVPTCAKENLSVETNKLYTCIISILIHLQILHVYHNFNVPYNVFYRISSCEAPCICNNFYYTPVMYYDILLSYSTRVVIRCEQLFCGGQCTLSEWLISRRGQSGSVCWRAVWHSV